jgi:hypothetical protein
MSHRGRFDWERKGCHARRYPIVSQYQFNYSRKILCLKLLPYISNNTGIALWISMQNLKDFMASFFQG